MAASANHVLELTSQFAKLFAFYVIVVLPANWVALRRLSDESIFARLALGTAAGFGLFVVSAWYVGWWSFDYLIGFWLLEALAAGWLGRKSNSSRAAGEGPWFRHKAWLLSVPLLACALIQLYALQFSELPLGVDSSFHCAIGRRLLDAGQATMDMSPLEQMRLNYPIGSHLWLAVAAHWTGLEVHQVFRHSFPIGMMATALVIASWAQRLFGEPSHGIGAATAFLTCTYQASLLPYTWGGLPSLLAMSQGIAALYCAAFLGHRAGLILATLLLGTTAMIHHHTMVALWGGAGAVAVFLTMVSGSSRAAARCLVLAIGGGVLVASIYVGPLILRAGRIGETSVLRFSEEFHWPWGHLWSWGPGLLVTTGIGLVASSRTESRFGRRLLVGLIVIWLLAFCVLDYGIRLLARYTGTVSNQPFTPSRFLFDAQIAMAVFSGFGLVRLWDWLSRPGFRYALIVGLSCWAIWQVEGNWGPVGSDALLPLGKWAQFNLPNNALITGSSSPWVTYVFDRESTSLFIPISELPDPERNRLKLELLYNPWRFGWSRWRQMLGKPIYLITLKNPDREPLFVSGDLAIYEAE